MEDAVVIGSGITGLATAFYLESNGISPCLIEGAARGGVIRTRREDGFLLEDGPNVFVEKPEIDGLLSKIGLSSEKVYPALDKFKQEIFFGGEAHAVPKGPGALISTRLLSWKSKAWLLRGLLARPVLEEEDESVAGMFGKIWGADITSRILDPVLKGIYGGELDQLSARAIFPGLWSTLKNGQPLLS